MLVQWNPPGQVPSIPGMYFLKLPDRSPLYVRLGTSGIVTHAQTALLVGMSREKFDRAQWSEPIEFAPWKTGK
jgi:hypothetical protein